MESSGVGGVAAVEASPPHVVIVGGGLAGLATVAALVDRGLRITLMESRPRLGGRASSFPDPATGELVDNCQHVSMACCTNLADFCRRVGTNGLFRREPELVFLGPEGQVSRFRAGVVPAPFHLAGSFLRPVSWASPTRSAWPTASPASRRGGTTGPASRSPTGCSATARPSGRSTGTGRPCSSRR